MRRGLGVVAAGAAALGGLAAAPIAWGQAALQDRFMAEHALQDARRSFSASQTEISNAQARADTAMRLRELDAQRAEPRLRPLSPDAPSRPDADLSASTLRLERLTQEALDESNARMRAIRPASEPKTR